MKEPLDSKGPISGLSLLRRLASRPMTTLEDMTEIIEALLDHGANLSAATERNNGPLRCAAMFNNYYALDALLMFNPSLSDVRDAMHVCIQKGNSWAALRMLRSIWRKYPELLLPTFQHGNTSSKLSSVPDLSLDDDNYLSALCRTWEHGRDDNLQESLLLDAVQSLKLLSNGAEALKRLLNQENNQILMCTPLHHAAMNGNVKAAEILVAEGADVNYSGRFHLDTLDSITGLEPTALDLGNDAIDVIETACRGTTPLDAALTRNWHMSIYIWPQWNRPFVQAIRQAGGSHAEERRYDQRTAEVVEFLRRKGAKTKSELFSLPEPVVVANRLRKEETMRKFEARETSRATFESDSKIMQFFEASCKLPSMHITVAKFPAIETNVDPDRPKLSSLFSNTIKTFQEFVNVNTWCDRNGQKLERMQSAYLLFTSWATRNGVEHGDIDIIQQIPPPSKSVQLAASVFICLCEILQTLQMLKELSCKTWRPKE